MMRVMHERWALCPNAGLRELESSPERFPLFPCRIADYMSLLLIVETGMFAKESRTGRRLPRSYDVLFPELEKTLRKGIHRKLE